jgi:hypothetical protein
VINIIDMRPWPPVVGLPIRLYPASLYCACALIKDFA